ncbi:hypothetical protein NXS98_01165 [Fontisphaera persica]|uniref:hypothetical protein n=1 Tax=Fontisphaera persica TaxID=2974023 RepID=UPI0024BF4946|nr:hypothetical protein [Fontisphaera persica]WCJ59756.1 hypothetical protein NXS98_01165 [Fontisphaera persica]
MATRRNVAGGILGCLLLLAAAGWSADKEVAKGIWQVGVIDPIGLRECSGVAAVRGRTNLFWMHSDGHRPVLYLVGRDGRDGRQYVIEGVALVDWEDLATDYRGHLYVADIGNNEAQRVELAVHQIPEPDLAKPEYPLQVIRSWRLRFPGAPFDCESLFIHEGYGYVISKVFNDAAAELYRFPLQPADKPVVLERLGAMSITSPVTGADISPDGRYLGVAAKNGVYLFEVQGRPVNAIGKPPAVARFKDRHIEGICYTPAGWIVTAETRHIFLFSERAFSRPKESKKP